MDEQGSAAARRAEQSVWRQSRVSARSVASCTIAPFGSSLGPTTRIAVRGDDMDDDLVRRIASHPAYQELKSKRATFGWWLTLAMMLAYYGFILLVAFNKPLLATRIGGGVMTFGMPLGVAVIVFTIVITAFYVRRANREFDALNEQIIKGVMK
jgi:uncharacterized membrane protein (DUF485 family)